MINGLPPPTSLGYQHTNQQMANLSQATADINHNNGEQVAARNIENTHESTNTKVLRERQEPEEQETDDQQEQQDDRQSLQPPPPTRFEVAVEASQEKLAQTQDAVLKFFLNAATNATIPEKQIQESAEAAEKPAYKPIDTVA